MADSNENTQNPKENQEKIAEKGNQEHSEHTAENKQPESKKTTTRRDLNKLRRKQKQIQQETQKTDHLETISKLIGISTVLGILFGGFVIFVYLLKINQLSILPDVISNPSSLIAAITIFIIIFIIIFLLYYLSVYLFLPEFIVLIQHPIQKWKSSKSNNFDKLERLVVRLFSTIIYFVIIYYLFKLLQIYLEYLFPQAGYIFLFLFSLLIASLIVSYFILNNSINFLNSIFKPNSTFKSSIKVAMTAGITLCLVIFGFSDKTAILNFTHSIEIRRNSSWYLLHNNFQQNNGSQETNGIDKNDLIKLKQNFKCSILSEEEKARKGIVKCSSIPEQRNNALYGYMAWNLGDTKVFCPPTIDNRKADSIETEDEDSKTKNEDSKTEGQKEADKLAEECIVISGKALQIMPESYISTNTDGIDDGNPDNTGHDDPAIDINTDVRFKNDLNAQSNAGLNNYNIQPVLPIQSNAKNMSIQINYGSCNHDSPRNKDGHPDIGYTDKKICQ
ncbi:MAG: hypothetical protein D8H97_26075 [Neisseria sp.]|nr:MAG: hypothetical protein D8H97_26075 [Neisseria sp.]